MRQEPLDPLAMVGIGWRQPHYAAVLEQRPALGFLEVHSENFFGTGGAARATLLQAREHYPISLHGVGLALGSAAGIDPVHLEALANLVDAVQPDWVSDHASFARAALQGQAVHALDLLPLPFHQAALDVLCANVQRVQDRLRRPIAVENLSAYLQWQGAEMSEPEFLNALARRTGCKLLVDVNNIYVNALNDTRTQIGVDGIEPLASCRDWLLAISPANVSELHLAGHTYCGDIVIDDHGSRVCPEVWSLYALAAQRFEHAITLIERDTDVPALEVLLDEAQRAQSIRAQIHDSNPDQLSAREEALA
jgi:uncharacterized protein (UPF0276 family)